MKTNDTSRYGKSGVRAWLGFTGFGRIYGKVILMEFTAGIDEGYHVS
jgi:hypothetical protein